MQWDDVRVSRKLWGALLGLVGVMGLTAGLALNRYAAEVLAKFKPPAV